MNFYSFFLVFFLVSCLSLTPLQARKVRISRHRQNVVQKGSPEDADAIAEQAVNDTDAAATAADEVTKDVISQVAGSLSQHKQPKTPEKAKAMEEIGANAAKSIIKTAKTELDEAKNKVESLEQGVKSGKIDPLQAANEVGRAEAIIGTTNVKGAVAHAVESNVNAEAAPKSKKF